jgi:pyruvate/2-oxoglutarate dehydrogenase complex dihydrolipoamide acyltransferase (E2) component
MNAAISALTVPKLGLTMKEGTVAAWHAQLGSSLAAGQPVFDVETEKVTSECAAEQPGVLRRQVAAAGAVLPVGALVAVLAPADVADADIDQFIADFQPEKQV